MCRTTTSFARSSRALSEVFPKTLVLLYDKMLHLVNAVGSDTTTVSIEILCDEVTVFSGFSPNDDGKNDNFKIMGLEKFPGSKVLVFNRWGNQVFEAVDYKSDWGGSFENKILPDGT